MSDNAAPEPDRPRPGRSVPLLLLGALLALFGAAGALQVIADYARPEAARGYLEYHAWAAGLIAPGAAILAFALDARRARRVAVAVIAGLLLAPGICSVLFAGGGWNARGLDSIGFAVALMVLWGVALIGLLLLPFRERAG